MSSIATSSSVSRQSHAVNWGQFARVGLATIVAATLANVVVYYLAQLFVPYGPQFVILGQVIGIAIFTVVPAIVATLLYAALLRFTRHPARIFTIIAAVVFVVTLIPDFTYVPDTVPGTTGGQIAVLALMHIVAAVVITGMLTRLTRPQSR